MVYLDTSVVLAHLLAEDRGPPERLWTRTLVSSRLLVYETWIRIHARNLGATHGEAVTHLIGRISFLELEPSILARALEPFPSPVRTLDALHLASVEFLRGLGQDVEFASYDQRQLEVARSLGLPVSGWV